MEDQNRSLVKLIGGPFWQLNKKMVQTLGINCAFWISDIFSKYEMYDREGKLDDEGFFYNVQNKIADETTLSPKQQTAIIKKLHKIGILKVKKAGLPARNYYKINIAKLANFLEEHSNSSRESLERPSGRHINNNQVNDNQSLDKDKPLSRSTSESRDSDVVGFQPQATPKSRPVLQRRNNRRKRDYINPAIDSEGKHFSPAACEVFNFWNSLGSPLTKHKESSKVARRGMRVVEKRVNNGNPPDEIKEAIKKYHELLSSKHTILQTKVPGHKVSLHEFFGFDTTTKERMRKAGVDLGIRSWFEECLPSKSPEIKFGARRKEDNHPRITNRLMNFYESRIGVRRKKLRPEQVNQFIMSADNFMKFYGENRRNLVIYRRPEELVDVLCKFLEKQFPEDLSPGNFSSKKTFDFFFPRYLKRQNILGGERGVRYEKETG